MRVLRIGHRGAAGHAPENTLLSIETALAMRVDVIEVDVQKTRDGQLVILHDWRVDSMTDGHGYVRALNFEQLRRLRTRIGNQQIPTLTEVLTLVSGRAGIMLELKVPGIGFQVLAAVRDTAFRGPVYFASFLHDELLRIRERDPQCLTVALLDGVPVNRLSFIRDALATHAGIAYNSLSQDFVSVLHASGYKVFTYTPNDAEEIAFARDCNVDGVISNYPDRI